jgi:hypothetical protein
MTSARPAALTLLASLGLAMILLFQLAGRYHNPYPPMTASLSTPQANLGDVGGVALGLRRISADLAWIQTLQYYGTPETGQSEADFENGLGHYPLFLAHCRHAAGIDPYFTYIYLYGGPVLGWNLNRLSEAEDLLKEGIARNPTEWRLPQYLAGLAYQKNHNVVELMRFLETVVQDPQCPLMMKALLANLYKKQRLFDKAIALWEIIYQTGDADYRLRAIRQVQDIQRLKHLPS